MKTTLTSKTVIHIIDNYRFTFHPFFEGQTGLLEIELFCYKKTLLGKKGCWERIYFGHIDPIRGAFDFYNEQIKLSIKKI